MSLELYYCSRFKNQPVDTGIPNAGFVFPGTPGWSTWDVAQLRQQFKDVKKGGTIVVNFEGGEAETGYGWDRSDADNLKALKMICRRAELIRMARPDATIGWDTAPETEGFDPWRHGGADVRARGHQRINQMIYEGPVRAYDFFSAQVYYARAFDDDVMKNFDCPDMYSNYYPGWTGRLRHAIDSFAGWGIPTRIMFEIGYSYGTVNEKKYRGHWIYGPELNLIQGILAGYGKPVILWNTTQPDSVEYRDDLPWPYEWKDAAENHPAFKQWVNAQKKTASKRTMSQLVSRITRGRSRRRR